jgi:lysophospholipase L1-like esterase
MTSATTDHRRSSLRYRANLRNCVSGRQGGHLLLGLWPREGVPRISQRHEVAAVNQLIGTCSGGARIRYADVGGQLLEPDGRLSPQISPDRLHFSAQGYARLVRSLDGLIDQLLAPR